jgi:pilus assembly protein CpaC
MNKTVKVKKLGTQHTVQQLSATALLLALACLMPQMRAQAQTSAASTLPAAGSQVQPTGRSMVPGMTCTGEVAAPSKIVLPIGKSTLLRLPEPVVHRSLGNPNVAQAMLVSSDTLYLLGIAVGTTNMILQGKQGLCSVIDVAITMDPAGLIATYKDLMPEEKDLRVSAAADSLVLSGTVSDSVAVARAVELALAYVRQPAVMSQGAQQEGLTNTQAATSVQQQQANLQQQQLRVINLLSVGSAQQVMLEVKVAEVSKTLIDKLGAGVNGTRGSGGWSYNILSNFITGTLGGTIGAARSANNGLSIEAEKKDGLVKVLAEPNVMAISGQEGSFLAGGKILIPVAQSTTGGAMTITLQEKEFGIGLKFTPTVLAGGRINLQVSPEVSELSRDGIGINNFNNTSTQILPLITTRRASTTVQLADGQSFAIGGLIKNNTTANIKAFPILGQLPILGALFRSTDFQNDRTELVFVVTPRLVKPLPNDYKLPTDSHIDPTSKDVLLGGKLEGAPPAEAKPAEPGQGAKPSDKANGFEMK